LELVALFQTDSGGGRKMAVDTQQVKELLGQGLSVGVVASAVGCSDSYITQLLSNEDFAAEVARLKIVALSADRKRDSSIDAIEDRLLRKLTDAISEGAFYKPNDLLHAFRIVNMARRRAAISGSADITQHNTVINLNIPQPVARHFTINNQGEVLQVDDQTLVTMPTGQLLSELGKKTGQHSKYAEVRNRLLSDTAGALPYEPPKA
jgi:hypothetical protein